MKKFLGILAVLIIIAVAGTYFSLGGIIKMAVGNVVPMITKTTAKIDSVNISLLSGHISLKGLAIGNPEGFSEKPVFSFGEVSVDVEPKSIFSDTIVVKKVVIDKVSASYERKDGKTNVEVIQNNVNSFTGTTQNKKASVAKNEKNADAGSDKKLIIDDLVFSDSKVNITALGKDVVISMPNIHLVKIGRDGKNTVSEVAGTIINAFMSEYVKSIGSATLDMFKDAGNNLSKTKELGKALKGLFK